MKNIRALGVCQAPGCGKKFQWDEKLFFVCPVHKSPAQYFMIDFKYEGRRIRRCTDFSLKPLRTYADAHSLLKQAQREIELKKFDPSKWVSKERIEFQFKTLIEKWYEDKEALLNKGQRAYSYVPKLKGYIRNYYGYFSEMDVREIMPVHIREWMRQLPDRAPKTLKNVKDALSSFFTVLYEDRILDHPLKFPEIEVPEYEPEVISSEVQMMVLAKIPTEHKPIFTFLFFQGCSQARRGLYNGGTSKTIS
jgi:hypothetical protein